MKITAVVTAHNEGRLLNDSLASVEASFREAVRFFPLEEYSILCILDNADQKTTRTASEFVSQWNLSTVRVDYRELSKSRNHAIRHLSSDVIAFLDADDLWGSSWVTGVLSLLTVDGCPPVVVHPELNYFFGTGFSSRVSHTMSHPDQIESPDFTHEIIFSNPWTALSAAKRETYLDHPFRPNSLDLGIGYEDWSFNADIAASKITHVVAPKTVHFIRESGRTSMKSKMAREDRTTAPSHSFSEL